MLEIFYSLLDEVTEFVNIKGRITTELSDSNWLCDLGFMVGISMYLTNLNT